MSKKTRSVSIRHSLPLSIALMTLMAFTVAADGEGTWVPAASEAACGPSTSGGSCPVGTTCSEWDVDGQTTTACCVPTESVGSGDPGACYATQ